MPLSGLRSIWETSGASLRSATVALPFAGPVSAQPEGRVGQGGGGGKRSQVHTFL